MENSRISKSDLLTKYLNSDIDRLVEISKSSFKKGNIIEAFVILHSAIEAELQTAWRIYLDYLIWKKFQASHKFNLWDYDHCVELLYQLNKINESERSVFMNFDKGRNRVVHHLINPSKRKKYDKKSLSTQFKNGLVAYHLIRKVILKLLESTGMFISEKEYEVLKSVGKIV